MRDDQLIEREANTRMVALVLLAVAAAAFLFLDLTRPGGDDDPPIGPLLVVDPNEAPAEVLLALPRLGPSLVARIVAARTTRPFTSIDDLDNRVTGIGPATRLALEPHLRIGP